VDVASSNRIPVADAGTSTQLGGCSSSQLYLNGHASYDLDGDDLHYEWSVISVPSSSTASNSNFTNPNIPTPLFEWDIPGIYTLQLQVFDGEDWSAPDLVNYTIGEMSENQRPVANSGENQSIEVSASCDDAGGSYSSGECSDCPASNIILDGTGSIDPNGDLLTFSWAEVTGNLEALGSSISVTTSAITDVMLPPRAYSSGTITDDFEFVLTVADCERSDDDTVYITYSCSGN
jgi:chitinase